LQQRFNVKISGSIFFDILFPYTISQCLVKEERKSAAAADELEFTTADNRDIACTLGGHAAAKSRSKVQCHPQYVGVMAVITRQFYSRPGNVH
jgi:hypothetical protein